MAEVPRKPRSWWPWIAALAAVALLVWGVLAIYDRDAIVEAGDPIEELDVPLDPGAGLAPAAEVWGADELPDAAVPAVDRFIRDCTLAGDPPRHAGNPRSFAIDCFDQFARALDDAAGAGAVDPAIVEGHAHRLSTSAQRLRDTEPGSAEEGRVARLTMTEVTGMLEALRAARRPADAALDRAVDQAMRATEAIREDRPLRDQEVAIQAFFRATASALQTAVRTPGNGGAPGS